MQVGSQSARMNIPPISVTVCNVQNITPVEMSRGQVDAVICGMEGGPCAVIIGSHKMLGATEGTPNLFPAHCAAVCSHINFYVWMSPTDWTLHRVP